MQPSESPVPPRTFQRRFHLLQRAALLLVFLVLAVFAWRLWHQNMLSTAGVARLVGEHPLLAPLAFMGLYALAMLFVLPTLPLNLGAGFLWGAELGALFALLGSTLGAVLAFLFARSAFGQPFARGFQSRLLQRLTSSLERGPWKVVAFVRLNPAVPTSVVNFLLGLTSLRLSTYVWGTFVFSAPLCYLFAYLGQATGGFVLDGDTGRLVRIAALSLGFGLLLCAGKRLLSGSTGVAGPAPRDPQG